MRNQHVERGASDEFLTLVVNQGRGARSLDDKPDRALDLASKLIADKDRATLGKTGFDSFFGFKTTWRRVTASRRAGG